MSEDFDDFPIRVDTRTIEKIFSDASGLSFVQFNRIVYLTPDDVVALVKALEETPGL